MNDESTITSPDDPSLGRLCDRLREMAGELDGGRGAPDEDLAWPGEQLRLCADHGVFRWFLPREVGGLEWSDVDLLRGYLALSAACLTTTFVLTQTTGACRRIVTGANDRLKSEVLGQLSRGDSLATLGISHLTTSRRHLARPVMTAERIDEGFRLNGFSPWVTGAARADFIVTGADLEDGRQVLVLLPTSTPGVVVARPQRLVALDASLTGRVDCENVVLDTRWLLTGPVRDAMSVGGGGSTGGIQTSTVAAGLADEAISYIEAEAEKRPDLVPVGAALRNEWSNLRDALLAAASGRPGRSKEQLRTDANSLVIRATHAALTAAKGAGYVQGHPVGRWCREALFFLVWSCPQPVLSANLCEFAGISA